MKIDALVAEIGSTTTIVNAFNNINGEFPALFGQGQAPTSVYEGDVRIGLRGAMEDLCRKKHISGLKYSEMFAASSAAGGLRMTVHGLVYDMTARAAREAALGAGAILHYMTAGQLRKSDIERIKAIKPNIILLAGGVDYGERDTVLRNAEMIKAMNLDVPVIYAGNCENTEEIKQIFGKETPDIKPSARKLYVVENVYPRIDELNIEPCRRAIQQAFEEHIISAPGMEHIRDMVNGPIIPTPGAVMESTKILYDIIGDLMVIDVGGATTDIHSVTKGTEKIARITTAPEPEAKRTVEGDFGVYVNRLRVVESIGWDNLNRRCEDRGINLEETLKDCGYIPENDAQLKLTEMLTEEAVMKAVERHAGRIRYVYGPAGRNTVAEGKDLTQVKYIAGTGGALTKLPGGRKIMQAIGLHDKTGMRLFPGEHTEVLVDNQYIMAAAGVLSKIYRPAAEKLLLDSLNIKL